MKRLKVNIIYLIGLLVLISSIGVVFAAFMFNQVVNMNGEIGGIEIESKKFLDYSLYETVSSSDENLNRKIRLRKDTVAILDDIILSYASTHSFTQDPQFKDGKVYYLKENDEYVVATAEDYSIGADVPFETFYEETKTYNGVERVTTLFNANCENITPTINGSVITFVNSGLTITVTCVIDANAGIIKSATASATSKDYRCVVDSDGKGLVVLDNEITNSSNGYTEVSTNNRIICSATQGRYDDPKNDDDNNKHYLSQYGFKFTFKTEIPVYVRVHIQDAWSSVKVYSSSVKERYVTKDKVAGKTPFNVTDSAWHYDEDTNYIYLKQMYDPNTDLDENDNFKSKTFIFNVNEAYFYQLGSIATAYTEYIDVELSFTVDIVQANRAKALWKIDPSVDFN